MKHTRKPTRKAALCVLTFAGLAAGGYGYASSHLAVFTSKGSAADMYLSHNHFERGNWGEDGPGFQGYPYPSSETTSSTPSSITSSTSPASSSSTDLPGDTQASGNWAGYVTNPATSSDLYTSVSGSWTVPTISSGSQGVAAQWIGLGGVSSDDLLQVGTMEQVQGGTTVDTVFWEKLPSAAQNVMTVSAGSTIDASIKQVSGSNWDVTITAKSSTGQTQSKTIPVTLTSSYAEGIGSSAEWISEDPSDMNGQLYPLANAGTVNFRSATVDGQALNDSANQVVPMALVTDEGQLLIAPSSLGSDGESFSTVTEDVGASSFGQGYSGETGRGGERGDRRFHRMPTGGAPWERGARFVTGQFGGTER
ncbi:hypothetical protein NZD89_07950 [Alicyclobacillus fastidiosus]|uniref:Peptidase A4 family protein n=1 Tax=Alicyclobacillus fastidiosus TaxID=392011 RepID=A0ABY6ZLG7_9BACL|nr:G1 family glutamic endopeptidase [Alicyclobacillus fastidiosus]WAH43312.1 hypothetical protein NZD89_07950 [Alicyclobacillus fastidiosus]GMA65366.1 hypothetical protein GCM10025859_58060 [Alicyclobacillus fastidiosus]